MRTIIRLGGLASALLTAQLTAGCLFMDQQLDGAYRLQAESQRPVKRRKVAHVVKPKPVAAGQGLREFCGKRHVEFQAGQLSEKPDEMARNNDLCRQIYSPEPAERPG